MSHVEINAGDRHIIIDHAAELEHVVNKAYELWQRTETPPDRPGPAYGFQAERRWSPTAQPEHVAPVEA